jgi:SAM-dependent methyltransferase
MVSGFGWKNGFLCKTMAAYVSAMKLHLGCGNDYRPGYVNCDKVTNVRADKHFDLRVMPWPFPDDCADEIVMHHVLEHLPDTLAVVEEIHRVLKPGGVAIIEVPYAKSGGAFGDVTHLRFFTEETMNVFVEGHPNNFYSTARFQVETTLKCYRKGLRYKLRNLIPLRSVLKTFWWNMYDLVEYRMTKVAIRDTAAGSKQSPP